MISVLPNNLSREPLEHQFEVDYKTLKRALIEEAKKRNMSIEVVEDTYCVSSGGFLSGLGSKAIPCVAFYHSKHKKDYHSIVLELKEAYGTHYLYIHMGGTSRNQRNINMGKSYMHIRGDGEIAHHRPGWFGKMISDEAEANMQDEELYYDAAYKLVGSAIVVAELMMIEPQTKTFPQPAAAQSKKSAPKTEKSTVSMPKTKNAETQQSAQKVSEQPRKNPQPTPEQPYRNEQVVHKPQHDPIAGKRLQKSIGIETMGGVFTKLISAGTLLPTEKSMVFSTAADRQTSVEINVLQGESEKASDNVSLGKYMLDGIMIAARGVPQIEVTFSVNGDGEFGLTAKDKTTDKELDIYVDNLLKPQEDQRSETAKETIPTAVCPLSVSQSDEEYLLWINEEIGFVTAAGVYVKAFEKETYMPTHRKVNLSVEAEGNKTTDIQVAEKLGASPQDNRTIGKLVLADIPYSMSGELLIEFDLAIDGKGKMTVSAKNVVKEKYLPITFVPKPQETRQPAQSRKTEEKGMSKVEQLKELADLLDRGALTQEEFEVLKRNILYK